MTRDALSWALSATVAGAAHLGLALFILNRIPPSAPPPPETEIMVDMIKVGQAQPQQPAQASAAAGLDKGSQTALRIAQRIGCSLQKENARAILRRRTELLECVVQRSAERPAVSPSDLWEFQ